MNKITQGAINAAIIIQDGETLTSSRSVAYVFQRQNQHVLRTVDSVKKEVGPQVDDPLYKPIKFYESSYINPQNHQKYRKVLMNRRAFLNVVMTFKGPKAFKFRNMYFQAFDNMEYQLRNTKPPMNRLKDRDQELIQQQASDYKSKYHQQKHINSLSILAIKANETKANKYDREIASPNVFPLSTLAERYGTDATTMSLVLQKIGVVRKLGGKWYLTKEYLNRGYACHNTDGLYEGRNTSSLKWTNKGFNFIREMLKLHFNITELHQMGNEFNNTFLLVRNNHKYEVRKLTAAQLKLVENWRNK